ncbi:TPA: DUF5361 domain-containing protein [Streptococcus agalactiae]|nr:DUF5361 domain-containing protein [Streptococcus agalactiae]HEN9129662.1 DUF5361 domain-containing protein [Streptococcus agalactiae]HEO0201306.1 DUF5361 domain-containing protein [Streptococcus agalactiae]HEO5831904.1 DUF5361 domain-containing protein [Streptococcus agalactiae]
MLKMDEDALVCDLAETYHIYDYKQLPPLKVVVFSLGLREESRINRVISGNRVSFERRILAGMFDRLGMLIWMKTTDGQKGKNRPEMVSTMFDNQQKDSEVVSFGSGKDFEETRNNILGFGGDS